MNPASQAVAELAAIYAIAPVVLFVVDGDLRVEKVNDLAARLAGRDIAGLVGGMPGEAVGCLHALTNPVGCGSGPECPRCPLRAAVLGSLADGAGRGGIEMPLPGGWLRFSTAAIGGGAARRILVCAQDISEAKRSQLALESVLAEKTILLQEIHHRVKNNLAIVAGLLNMKAEGAAGEARRALEESRQRVQSMALIHQLLYGNDRLDRIDFARYARQLVDGLRHAFDVEAAGIAVELAVAPFQLGIERAVPCGLILNELLTNAFKYAFRGRRPGRIRVSFHEFPNGECELAVEDDGGGMPSDRQDASLGLRIVHLLARQLSATLTCDSAHGTRVVLRLPPSGPR